ncbi:hypothetical protein HanIR_Chr06g0261121 [Helianthus annuus]|nr:hypothetical protein HanIR_Chr06g0261121 [Helianthus annuus]
MNKNPFVINKILLKPNGSLPSRSRLIQRIRLFLLTRMRQTHIQQSFLMGQKLPWWKQG